MVHEQTESVHDNPYWEGDEPPFVVSPPNRPFVVSLSNHAPRAERET